MSNDSLLGNQQANTLINQAITWCGLHGLMYTDGVMTWSHAPIAFVPNPYPRTSFNSLTHLQPVINKLIDRISRDKTFLVSHLSEVSKADPFTGKLLEIFEGLDEEEIKTGLSFGILRSDYMLNSVEDKEYPLQIEINTIASSFGCLSRRVGELHKYLLNRNADITVLNQLLKLSAVADDDGKTCSDVASIVHDRIPENPSLSSLAASLAQAHNVYKQKIGTASTSTSEPVIVFVVQPNERNVADQRLLENEIWTSHQVSVQFHTLQYLYENSFVNEQQELCLKDKEGEETKVSVVYYRAGYTPDDYPTDMQWQARIRMEHSNAIKCPNIGYHLAGTKKIQQVLCQPGVLEQYLDSNECQQLRATFAEQHSLGSMKTSASDAAVANAIKDGSNWVLKPQREGGGNNLYGEELSAFLASHEGDNAVLGGYILMQRIFPSQQSSIFLRLQADKLEYLPSVSELGVYGTYLAQGGEAEQVLMNEYAGYLLRSKPAGVDEGGVATGYSVLNSIALMD